MKKTPTQKVNPDQAAQNAAPDNETVNHTQDKMKKLISTQLDKVTLHYQKGDHVYPRRKGAVEINADEIGNMTEGLALMLVLLAGARKLYLAKDTFLAITDGVWFHLDRERGGLTAEAEELFGDDEDVLAAAAAHREVVQAKKNKAE